MIQVLKRFALLRRSSILPRAGLLKLLQPRAITCTKEPSFEISGASSYLDIMIGPFKSTSLL